MKNTFNRSSPENERTSNVSRGAHAVLETLVWGGVNICFTNPGTSEMDFVSELGSQEGIRGILCPFEGVATGAADGYGRMLDKPACTLLHLGPGLSNGIANLHNASRAGTPIVNIVGDHALYHKKYDSLLESDIDGLAGTVSQWMRRTTSVNEAGQDAADAIVATGRPQNGTGGIATLILPADICWSMGGRSASVDLKSKHTPDNAALEELAQNLRRHGPQATLLLGGALLRRGGRRAASRISQALGTRLLAESAPARQERGAGIPEIERLVEATAAAQLAGTKSLMIAGARVPVALFAFPGKASSLVPSDVPVIELDASASSLEELADLVAPNMSPMPVELIRPGLPSGQLTVKKVAAIIAALLPEGAIVSDEAVTSGWWLPGMTAHCPPHDWLSLTGGAIGQGMPVALGAAIACPDRPVINIQADGSSLYTIQSLWTQARESANVTTVILNNSSYAILKLELQRRGGIGNGKGTDLLDLPGIDFVSLARGLGVPGCRVESAEDFVAQLRRGLREPGPFVIEVAVPPVTSLQDRPRPSERY